METQISTIKSPEADAIDMGQRRYRHSPKGKAALRKYRRSTKGRRASSRYNRSHSGKERQQVYRVSDKGKATAQRTNDKKREHRMYAGIIKDRLERGVCPICGGECIDVCSVQQVSILVFH